MPPSHKGNQSRSLNVLTKIAISFSISAVLALYLHLRGDNYSFLLRGGIFIAGYMLLYFSAGQIFAFVNMRLQSKHEEKAYTIKSIVYLVVIWGVVLASRQPYWIFEAQHEIGICPGWSNNSEETSYPILVQVTDQGTNEDIRLSEFRDKDQEQYALFEGQALEIRDCAYYHYSDSAKLEIVSFKFISGQEYLPVQVTANDAGAVLDLDSGDELQAEIELSPQFRYNLTTETFLQYAIRWITLLCLAVVFTVYSLLAIQYLVSFITRLFKLETSPAHTQILLIQSSMISFWLAQALEIKGHGFVLVWLLFTIATYVGLSFISSKIKPASEDADTLSKVVFFAFCVSIALTFFTPLQPKGLFGIHYSSQLSNLLFNGRLIGKVALLDIFMWAFFLFLTDTRRVRPPNETLSRRWIAIYALPMMAVGFVMLLTFYPGIMSQDSFYSWRHMSTFTFDDHQPILYALILWIVTRLWMSPAMVAIVQIIGLSSAVGYAFYRLEKIGVPKQWIVVAVFAAAVLPANAFFMVTLWKDVLYAILYVWLTVFMLELYISKGMWIIQKKNMVLLAGVIIFVTLLRYNGFIEMTLLLFALFIFYKRFWRRWIIIGVVAFSVMTTANYTFDQFLPKTENPMRKTTEGAFARILEARIKAHIYSGTELQQREQTLLAKTMPSLAVLKRYNCHVSLPPNFYHSDMLFDPDNRDELVSTYLAFATRSPWVEVRHQICNLSILWRVYPREGETKELVPVKVRSWSNELIYQVTPALAELHGISQESKRPQLARSLGEYMGDMVRDDSLHVALWRVAPFAYIIVIGLVFRAVAYDKDIRVLVLGSPAIAHLAIFTFGNLYEDFRFHYMILPIACILWPLLFLRGRIHKPDEE